MKGLSGVICGVSKEVYLGVPYTVAEQGIGDQCVPKLIEQLQLLRL